MPKSALWSQNLKLLENVMNLRNLFAAALMLVCTQGANAQPTSVETLTTANGIEFYFAPMPNEERVNIDVIWPTDWLMDEQRNALAPAVGAQLMLAGGAADLDPAELQSQFSDLVSDGSVNAIADHVRGRLSVRHDQVQEAVAIANKVLVAPRFDERWLQRIKDGITDRVAKEKTQSAYQGWDGVRRLVFGNSATYRFNSNGGDQPVETVTRDDVVAWHKRTFVTSSAMITVAGQISGDDAKLRVDELFAGMPAGEPVAPYEVEATYLPKTIIVQNDAIEKTTLAYLAPLSPTSEGGEYEDIVATHILGGGEQSRLFQAVRQQLRATYGFSAGLSAYTRKNRFIALSGEVETEKLQDVRDLVKTTYTDFLQTGVTEEEAGALRTMFSDGLKVNLSHASVVTYVIAESVLDGYSADRLLSLAQELKTLDAEKVNIHIASKFPKFDQFIELIVTPKPIEQPGACLVQTANDIENCLN
ncbi:M16 family metallopeptidase [Maritalea porphyrae]|uniref:M16 family metallopeptidase n=2 Tax=Maritalea TaxID=623276 RepID=UPI0022AEA8CD|nr:insulinase family protein [Maritalea porphyrae]MCZ4272056.1 insulinase family protein [Maritalea porphyrae]